MSFPKALLSSIPRLLFVMLVCLGFLGFMALPAVGEQLGSLVCENGETMTSVTTPYSRPGESGETVDYFCTGADGRRAVAFETLIFAALKVYAAFFLLVIWPLLAFLKYRGSAFAERMEREGVPATVRIVSAQQTSMRVNDAPVVKLELEIEPQGLPAFTKSMRKRVPEYDIPAMQPGATFRGLVDPRHPTNVLIQFDQPASRTTVNVNSRTITMDELPPQFADLVAKAVGAAGTSTASGFGESNDEVDALRALKAMRDEGLISHEEYAAKKAEIMGRM